MIRYWYRPLAVVLLATIVLSCAGPSASGPPTSPGPSAPSPSGNRPSSPAVVAIVEPVSGESVTGATVHVVLSLTGAPIVSATTTNIHPDEGHVHLYVDNVLVSMNYGLEQDLPVQPGHLRPQGRVRRRRPRAVQPARLVAGGLLHGQMSWPAAFLTLAGRPGRSWWSPSSWRRSARRRCTTASCWRSRIAISSRGRAGRLADVVSAAQLQVTGTTSPRSSRPPPRARPRRS